MPKTPREAAAEVNQIFCMVSFFLEYQPSGLILLINSSLHIQP
jgi:hypothetical protein